MAIKDATKPMFGYPEHSAAIWQLDIRELTGHNIESKGREQVNKLLKGGWVLLNVYILHYQEDGMWHERPMAILGKPGIVFHSNAASSGRVPYPRAVPKVAKSKFGIWNIAKGRNSN